MRAYEEQLYNTFKERFFNWFLTYEDYNEFSSVLMNLLLMLKQELMARDISFFQFDPMRKVFFLNLTTNEEIRKQGPYDTEIPYDAFQSSDGTENPLTILRDVQLTKIHFLLGTSEELIGVLQMISNENTSYSEPFLLKVREDFIKLFKQLRKFSRDLSEEKGYERLHRLTAKIHSSMRIDDVLQEIIRTLEQVYPSYTCHLFLSHDDHDLGDLPIKMLGFENENENIGAMQAYVTGQLQIEDSINPQRSTIYAPIKGAQGVYGVLEIVAPHIKVFTKSEINFVSLLASTAGSALENAKLYEQSRRLIADLQFINETMHRLNTNLRLQDALTFMVDQIREFFGAEEVGFILFEKQKQKMLSGSTAFFQSPQAKSYVDFIINRIKNDKDIVFLGDAKIDASALAPRFRSVMAVPMVQSSILKGIAIVVHTKPYYFTFEMYKLLQSLIHHSTLVFANAMLRDELERLVVTDRLTNLFSRHYLDEQIARSMEQDSYGTFILIDIDNFKSINDTYGHQTGDEIIIQVANIIKANIREGDIGARWGGEELAIYLPKASLAVGVAVATRLVEKVRQLTAPPITISCGVSYWKKKRTDTLRELFKRADEALYSAKKTGKNCVVIKGFNEQYKV